MPDFRSLTRKHLKILLEINKTGSFQDAAGVLGLTPSAVSMAIKTVDSLVGDATIRRDNGRQLEFTDAGQELTQLAEELESLIARSEERVRALRQGRSGHVRVGAVSTAKYFAPSLLASAMRTFPDIEIDLMDRNREGMINALANGGIDFAVMGRPPRLPAVHAKSLAPNPHVFVAHPEQSFAGTFSDFADNLFLVREEGSGTRLLFERFIDQHHPNTGINRKVLDSNETIKQAVMSELGLALLSRSTVDAELAGGRLKIISLPHTPILRQWFLVYPQARELSPVAKRVFDHFHEIGVRL